MQFRRVYLLLFTTGLPLFVLTQMWTVSISQAALPTISTILIEAVHYYGQSAGQLDEAVRLANMSDQSISLDGWSLQDGEQIVHLPAVAVAPDASIWIARDADAFRDQFGHWPDVAASTLVTHVVPTESGWFSLSNTGDEVLLYDRHGQLIDAVVFRRSVPAELNSHWEGGALHPFQLHSGTAIRGQILWRKLHPFTGRPFTDTNTASDWMQDPADRLLGRRVTYPGWEMEQFFFPYEITTTSPVTIVIAPDHAYSELSKLIGAAKVEIIGAAHTFDHPVIAQQLANAAAKGVDVKLLLEGAPPGGISDEQRYACHLLYQANGRCWFMITLSDDHIYDRYTYSHAKYLLIDQKLAVIGSENLSAQSLPADSKVDGTAGRRGVYLISSDPQIIAYIQRIFDNDLQPLVFRDIVEYDPASLTYGAPPAGYRPPSVPNWVTYTVRFPTSITVNDVTQAGIELAPENSMHPNGLTWRLLNSAGTGDSVLVEQLREPAAWGDVLSPRIEAYLDAARRGAHVRILVDSYFDSASSTNSNAAACDFLNGTARAEGLDLACRHKNPTGLGIHNKMLLLNINGRGYVHVGSLNGSEQAYKGNREIALVLQSDAAFAVLGQMFSADWGHELFLPFALRERAERPITHPLISELLPNPHGTDEAEFIEIVNPGYQSIEIGGYALSEIQEPHEYGDVRRFPAGTRLPPQSSIVVALHGQLFFESYGFWPDFELVNTTPHSPEMIDDSRWGYPGLVLQMGNQGDKITIFDPADAVVDTVAYGNDSEGHLACPIPPSGYSLRRRPFWLDSDSCVDDFEIWPFPNPGVVDPAD